MIIQNGKEVKAEQLNFPGMNDATNTDGVFFYRVCNRCKKELKYISGTYFKKIISDNPKECKYCKCILDPYLEAFKQSRYERQCPQCKKIIVYRCRSAYRTACRANSICKTCAHIPFIEQQKIATREFWEPIIGRWNLQPKTLHMIKYHWKSLSEEEKKSILEKTPQQKDYYWGHLRRKLRAAGHRKCREVIAERWGGDKHWMKRPEVLAKIKKSCEKYRGDGHWFRRNKKV